MDAALLAKRAEKAEKKRLWRRGKREEKQKLDNQRRERERLEGVDPFAIRLMPFWLCVGITPLPVGVFGIDWDLNTIARLSC